MIKIYFSFLICLFSFDALAQVTIGSNEIEPNNSFSTADTLLYYDPFYSTLNATDTVDYHLLDHTFTNGGITLFLEATNNSTTDSSRLTISFYDGRMGAGLLQTYNVGGTNKIPPGETVYDTLYICSTGADIYYAKYSSNGDFNYTAEWYYFYTINEETVSGINNTQLLYNDTRSQATAFTGNLDAYKSGGIGFIRQGLKDTVDYWKANINQGNASAKILKIKAQNYGCIQDNYLNYSLYRNTNPVPFLQGSILLPYTYGDDVVRIPLTGLQQNDSLFIKLSDDNAARYDMKIYEGIDYEDDEDNDYIYEAVPTNPSEVYGGNVGAENIYAEIDYQDVYRFITPYAGAAKFNFTASNDECGGNSRLKFYVYDKYGNYINYGYSIFQWDETSICDSIQTAEVKFRALEKDTFYLQLHADDRDFSRNVDSGSSHSGLPIYRPSTSANFVGTVPYSVTYSFIYEFTDSAHVDPEPNSSLSEAINVNPGEVKKGHVNFHTTYNQNDSYDYYGLNLPVAANVDIYIKSTYRNDYDSYLGYGYGPIRWQSINQSFLNDRLPRYPYVEVAYPDSTYLDTIHLCGVGKGITNIRINGISEYEFYFLVKDTVVTNEIEPNYNRVLAQTLTDSSLVKGTINYFQDNEYDGTDNFKIPIVNSDSITLYVKATNRKCTTPVGNRFIQFNGQRNGNVQVFNKIIGSNIQSVGGETIYDTIKFKVNAPDTLFLNVGSTNSNFEYEFKTNAFRPTSQFFIDGDSTVCAGPNMQQYVAKNIGQSNLVYHWSLPAGGGTISNVDSVASVTWNTNGIFPLQLYLTNSKGSSDTVTVNVIVNGTLPTTAPTIFNFARNLSLSPVPVGATVQWYRNNSPIAGATDSIYYAALGGNYTARFINDCGAGPISNPYNFPADVLAQTITFPHTSPQSFSSNLKTQLPATASSGLPVFYTKISGPATIVNDSLLVTGAGTIIVKASQPGNDSYSAAIAKYDTINMYQRVVRPLLLAIPWIRVTVPETIG